MAQAYIGLGSNVGNREDFIQQAIKALAQLEHTQVMQVSSLYETEPLEYPDQHWFINAVVQIETSLPPDKLLTGLQAIEEHLQVERSIRWGPRTIDLDILLYDDEIVCSSRLQIPHLRLHLRTFVLVPLAEIAPAYSHPILNKPIADLLTAHTRRTEVKKLQPSPC